MTEHTNQIPVGEFESVSELILTSESLQIAFVALVVGIIAIASIYRKFSNWVESQKFSYTRPHMARFIKTGLLPVFAIALITSINVYAQAFELFGTEIEGEVSKPKETFAKILNTINFLVIGYAVGKLIPVILDKRAKSLLQHDDYVEWKERRGFLDDDGDLFHKLMEWIPPKNAPEGFDQKEFEKMLTIKEERKRLEHYRTAKGIPVGTFRSLVKNPFKEWQKSEWQKYEKYYDACVSGNNESGRKLMPGVEPQEIFPIDTWREEKRENDYEPIIPGDKPPGYAKKKRQGLPKSLNQIIPTMIIAATVAAIVSWWGVDLFVLGTIVAGLGIGIGFALKETMENFFAYLMIRKDKIFIEGDRVEIDNYNGYIHKITSRVTYVRHALNESMAIFPTRQLVAAKVINFSKEIKYVPALVYVGVSYLNNAKQVASILTKIGKRAMREIKDEKNNHIVVQNRCPYLDVNKPSCGCDKGVMIDLNQPKVRFYAFNDSSLDFKLWVYVRDYTMQFRVESAMNMMIQEEFAKHDIRIPWPIRTIYEGNEKREAEEMSQKEKVRQETLSEYGIGDVRLEE